MCSLFETLTLYFRALSMIYNELEKRTSEDLSVHISYIEIYQDVGYDLLNPGARTQSFVTPFPKVTLLTFLQKLEFRALNIKFGFSFYDKTNSSVLIKYMTV